jgi:sugar lactone lactonase YvrE
MPHAEQLTDAVAYHGEGPVWAHGALHWVDMLAGDVLTLDTHGAIGRRHIGGTVAVIRPRTRGGYIYAVERGFALADGADSALTTLPELWTDTGIRMNEGGCDPDGRFYCGSMAYDVTPGAGSLYRLDPDGSVHTVLTDVTISNGLAWDPTGTRAYYVDTPTHRIDVFDYHPDSGLTDRRPFVHVAGQGGPDGLTVDAEGGIWVAIWGAGQVRHYSPDATLAEVIELPASQVSACTFGGPDLTELYITTSREGLPGTEQPSAGALFVAHPGTRGLPVTPFAG